VPNRRFPVIVLLNGERNAIGFAVSQEIGEIDLAFSQMDLIPTRSSSRPHDEEGTSR